MAIIAAATRPAPEPWRRGREGMGRRGEGRGGEGGREGAGRGGEGRREKEVNRSHCE